MLQQNHQAFLTLSLMIKIGFGPVETRRWKITEYSVFLVKYCHLHLNTFFSIKMSHIYNASHLKINYIQIYSFITIKNKKALCVVTIGMICCNLASLWKFQYFRMSVYNRVEHVWWSFYHKNSKPLSIFTKKLHHRSLLGF